MSADAVRLRDVASINPRLISRPNADAVVSFLGMADVDAERGTTSAGDPRQFGDVAKGYTQFENGDILLARITPCFENGKIAQATLANRAGAGSTEFHVIRPENSKLDARYLLHFLRQPIIRAAGERRMTGSAGQRRVPESFLSELKLPVRPLVEQRRIAEVLDRADALRAKRRQAIALLDDLAQSLFIDMFGADLAAPRGRLGDYLSFITSGGRGWAKYYAESGDRFIRSLDVRMNEIATVGAIWVRPPDNAEARRTRISSGDVLLTITGSLIGRVAPTGPIHDGNYVSQHVAILRPDREQLFPEFLSFFLSLPNGGQRQISTMQYGQTKPGLNFEQIKKIEIPSVPLDKQREFVHRLRNLKQLSHDHRTHLAHLDTLFASLQSRAFRGELWETDLDHLEGDGLS